MYLLPHIILLLPTVYRSSSAEAVCDINDNLRIKYVLWCIHDMQTETSQWFDEKI